MVLEQISNLIYFSGLPLAKQVSPSSVTRASPSLRLLGSVWVLFWTFWCWRPRQRGRAGWWQGPLSCWTRRGRSATAQSSPGENSRYLFYSIFGNMMARCVARNPNEIVRQLAAARELDLAMVGKVFKPESRLIFFCRRELSCLLAGRLGMLRCQPVLRRGKLSLAWTIGRWRRRVAATWPSPRLNNIKSFDLPFVCQLQSDQPRFWTQSTSPTSSRDSELIAGCPVPNQWKTQSLWMRSLRMCTNLCFYSVLSSALVDCSNKCVNMSAIWTIPVVSIEGWRLKSRTAHHPEELR